MMNTRRGALYAAAAYIAWGLLPIYWKALHHVPALNLLAHRVVWSLVVAIFITTGQRHWGVIRQALGQPRTVLLFIASGLLLGVNWLIYIWAVQANLVVEASLGYFINPLINVLLGVLFLRERLRMSQTLAIGLAALAVLYLTIGYGSLPWIALTLALSFGGYGLLRKMASLGPLDGLTFETMMMAIPAFIFLAFQQTSGVGVFNPSDPTTVILLLCSGVLTSVPLILFAAGARQVTMVTLGLLQYIAPTIQFLLGVFLYGEVLTPERLLGFGLIWIALGIYSLESIWHSRRPMLAATPR